MAYAFGAPDAPYAPPPVTVDDMELFDTQKTIIREAVDRGPAVVVGRAGYWILKGEKGRQIPDYVLSGVGDRRLTAFTIGLPYAFLRTSKVDWSRKAIGHVASDPALIVLSEIYGQGGARFPVTFNLIFDPGFFQTSETDDVIKVLEQHFTHTILLSEENADPLSLLRLPHLLPLEIIFFNTHGSDNSILLQKMPLMNYAIPQWVSLPSRPLVFNNSCLSWTGVGREFIRVGARGYVGTLWSVDAKAAANFARVVMQRLVRGGLPVSEAICGTGLDSFTERAYLYVGTANARLDEWPGSSGKEDQTYCLEALEALFGALASIVSDLEGTRSAMLELERLLYQEARTFTLRLQKDPGGDSVDEVDVLILEAYILSRRQGKLNQDPQYEDQLIAAILAKLDHLSIPDSMKQGRFAQVYYLSGKLKKGRGQLEKALEDMRQSAQFDEAGGDQAGTQYQVMVEIFKQMGKYEQAREAALEAKERHEREGDERGALYSLGQLGQITKRMHNFEESMQYAVEGFEKAVKLGEISEQMAFKGDQAQILLGLGDFDKAIEAAKAEAKLACSIFNRLGELKAYGILGRCYISKKEFDQAQEYILKGLEQARKIEDLAEEADFLMDLGEVLSAQGDLDGALECLVLSFQINSELGNMEKVVFNLDFIIGIYVRQRDWIQSFKVMMIITFITQEVDDSLRFLILKGIIENLKEILKLAESEEVRALLLEFFQKTAGLIDTDPEKASNLLRFLADTLGMFFNWVEGHRQQALDRARFLDQASQGAFDFKTFVAVPYVKKPTS